MNNQNEKANKSGITELTLEQMDKVTGGTHEPRTPGRKTYVFEDSVAPDVSTQSTSTPGALPVVTSITETFSRPAPVVHEQNRKKTPGESIYIFEEYETPL